jgi:hypothetical protein
VPHFSPEERARAREHVLALARRDDRVSGGAITGSSAAGREDRWSDIDLSFGIQDEFEPEDVLADWTERLTGELDVLHYWDLRHGATIYRVLLLPGALELDIAVTPAADFGARGPNFKLVFGEAREHEPRRWALDELIGLGWLHALDARVAIERGRFWQAEYWVSGLRNQALALACIRFRERPDYARGTDRLPRSVLATYEDAFVRSLNASELRRALRVSVDHFLAELGELDESLARRVGPCLREVAGQACQRA